MISEAAERRKNKKSKVERSGGTPATNEIIKIHDGMEPEFFKKEKRNKRNSEISSGNVVGPIASGGNRGP